MLKLIIASNNQHKIGEIKKILKDFPLQIMSLKEADIKVEVEETGTTFLENAALKAEAIKELAPGCMVLSDDSGLSVDALKGEPGVYSARYSGEHGNDELNRKVLLQNLKDVPKEDRTAHFTCAMVLILPDNSSIRVEGKAYGVIGFEEKGSNGFGYDSLFYVPEYELTFAEMEEELKNRISHRANALQLLKKELEGRGLRAL